MELVKNLDHYNELLNQAKSKGNLKFSNCLFLKQDIIDLTNKNNLFYKFVENGIFFFKNNKNLVYLYYYLNSFRNINLNGINKNLMIELVDRKNSNRAKSHVEEWEKSGFSKYCTNREMILTLSEEKKEHIYDEEKDFTIRLGYLEETDRILKLWAANLDEISMPLPTKDELVKLIKNNQIVVLLANGKKLVGAMQFSIENNRSLFSHIVIDKNFRNKGLGTKMINYCLKYSSVDKFYLWVNENNKKAIDIYTKLGYEFSTKISIQLLKMEELS